MNDLCHFHKNTDQSIKLEYLPSLYGHRIFYKNGTFHDREKVTEMGLYTKF